MSNSNNYELTDIGNGKRLVDRHGRNLRHCLPLNQWYRWNGKFWETVVSGELMRHAKETALAIVEEAQRIPPAQAGIVFRHANSSQSVSRLKGMIELAASEEEIAVAARDLDAAPFLFCAGNGTINLKTGELGPHLREHLITQHSDVDYDLNARAPLFENLVYNMTGRNQELASFLQRAIGYAATGSRQEHALFILHGLGGEGKTTFLEAIAKALGSYAQHIPTETLMAKRTGSISNDVARMQGKRLGHASEVDQGKALDEALIKQLTGGDTITARGLYREHIEFTNVPKLFVATNHMPTIKGTDNGIWRRIKVIPCVSNIAAADRDPALAEKLDVELQGILAWIVRGCLDWQRLGLKEPQAVIQAVASYRGDMDTIGSFLKEACLDRVRATIFCKDLYGAYVDWTLESGERPLSSRGFNGELRARGYVTEKSTKGMYRWAGLTLRPVVAEFSLKEFSSD